MATLTVLLFILLFTGQLNAVQFSVLSPKKLVEEVNTFKYVDFYRGGLKFNRADFHTQPYGAVYEAPGIWGYSQTAADG
jgi:hypothetical protein